MWVGGGGGWWTEDGWHPLTDRTALQLSRPLEGGREGGRGGGSYDNVIAEHSAEWKETEKTMQMHTPKAEQWTGFKLSHSRSSSSLALYQMNHHVCLL